MVPEIGVGGTGDKDRLVGGSIVVARRRQQVRLNPAMRKRWRAHQLLMDNLNALFRLKSGR